MKGKYPLLHDTIKLVVLAFMGLFQGRGISHITDFETKYATVTTEIKSSFTLAFPHKILMIETINAPKLQVLYQYKTVSIHDLQRDNILVHHQIQDAFKSPSCSLRNLLKPSTSFLIQSRSNIRMQI